MRERRPGETRMEALSGTWVPVVGGTVICHYDIGVVDKGAIGIILSVTDVPDNRFSVVIFTNGAVRRFDAEENAYLLRPLVLSNLLDEDYDYQDADTARRQFQEGYFEKVFGGLRAI
ncbi:MAG: hypothetical protein RJQ08_10890 [Salinisphaeraceae bacterium]